MNTCRYEDFRSRFRCPEAAGARSSWCFWHDPEQPKTREAVEAAVTARRNLTGAWLEGIDLSGASLENVCLYGAVLRFSRLEGALLNRADLRFADLSGATLAEAEMEDALLEGCNLSGASLRKGVLRYANLTDANLEGADLSAADLVSAHLIGANLSRSDLQLSTCSLANLGRANLAHATIDHADLAGANLTGADIRNAALQDVKLDRATRLGDVRYNRRTLFAEIDTSAIDPARFPVLLREIQDRQYLDDLRRRRPLLYRLWQATSDCGRSVGRWGILYGTTGLLFGAIRNLFPGAIEGTGSADVAGRFLQAFTHLLTLGGAGGGIAANRGGQALLLGETAAAYLLFAGLLSLLYGRLARRS